MEAIAVTQEFILDTLRANQKRLRDEFGIERIGLYGSFARNEQTTKRDLDLVHELKPDCQLPWAEKERLYRILRRKLHGKLDLVDWKYVNPIIGYYLKEDLIYV